MRMEEGGRVVFRYRMSGVGWLCACLLMALAMTVIAFPEWALDAIKRGAIFVLPMLVLVPAIILALDIVWVVNGRVIVTPESIRWQGIRGSGDVWLGDILAVGAPSTAWQRREDLRIHVVTRDGYTFVHSHQLPNRRELVELLVQRAGLADRAQVRRHTFFVRPGSRDKVVEQANEHVFRSTALQWTYWAPKDTNPKARGPWK